MRKNRDGKWRKEKVAGMLRAERYVLEGEGGIVSCRYGLPHGMPKIMQGRSKGEWIDVLIDKGMT